MVLYSIRSSIDDGFSVFFAWLPRVIGFLAVILIGYIIAKVVGNLVFRLAHRAGLDRTMHSGAGGNVIQRAIPSPSRLLGKVTFWALFLGAVSIAASVLGIKALTAFVGAVWAYIPNVIAALLIFLIAGAIAAAVVALVQRVMGDTGLGKILATAVPIIVMTVAIFMILVQLKIAIQIVTITYAAIWAAIALGAALAFGLGGRDVAARMLEGAYEKGRANKEQYKQELAQGKERAKQQVDQVREQAQTSGPGATTRPQPEPGR